MKKLFVAMMIVITIMFVKIYFMINLFNHISFVKFIITVTMVQIVLIVVKVVLTKK